MITSANGYWFLIKIESDYCNCDTEIQESKSIVSFSLDEVEIKTHCKKLNSTNDDRFVSYDVEQGSFWP